MSLLFYRALADGTKVSVEYHGAAGDTGPANDIAHVLVSKGKVHRSMGFTLAEAVVLAELLSQLPKPEGS